MIRTRELGAGELAAQGDAIEELHGDRLDALLVRQAFPEDLRRALATRDLIWSAKTIIASATGADPEEAHRLLVRQSQHENRKLRDVATELAQALTHYPNHAAPTPAHIKPKPSKPRSAPIRGGKR